MRSHAWQRMAVCLVSAVSLLAACSAPNPNQSPPRPSAALIPPAPVATPAPLATPATAGASEKSAPPVQYVGKFELNPKNAPPGTVVHAAGKDLPANKDLRLDWHTAKGSWMLKGQYNEEFHGRQFKEITVPLARVKTDAEGAFHTQFIVPEDWGFDHDVTVVETETGIIRNKSNFSVDMQVSISPTSGPPGTPITITARGIGYRYMYNSWVLTYDNKLTGWLSSVTTGGKATAVIPATGTPGKHVLHVSHGWSTVSYLNTQQSPQPDRPSFTFEFTVTEGAPVLPKAAEQQGIAREPGTAPPGSGPALWTSIISGRVGDPVRINGRGLPPGQEVELLWSRMVGNRIVSTGWSEETIPLGKVAADPQGNLRWDMKVPDDLGGPHRLEAKAGGNVVASGNFTLTPSTFALEPASGPVGTTIRVHLKGGGWTETANIYMLNYDNSYIGFACSFNSQGDIEVLLKATGEPGWHFIDLYPGLYRGKDIQGVQNFRFPQLTAEEDHPGERLPIFRLAFLVTP